MGKLGSGLLIVSNVVGNVACAVGAYYAAGNYYGWNAKPLPLSSAIGGHIAMPPPGASFMPAFVLIMVGVALLVPSWVVLFRVVRTRGLAPQPREIARDTAPIQRQDAGNATAELALPLTPLPADRYESPGLTRARELMDLCTGRTDVEMKQITSEHAGELLELSSIVYDVRTFSDDSAATIAIDPDPAKSGLIHAHIVDKDRVKRATFLRKGDKIKVSGKISDISKYSLSLTDCEFTRL